MTDTPAEGRRRLTVLRAVVPLLPYFKPYLWRFVLVLTVTIAGAASEAGQVWLIQPLMNRVLLRGSDSDGEEADAEFEKQAKQHAAGITEAKQRAMARPPVDRLEDFVVFAGRAAQESWVGVPVCELMERTRRILRDAERDLEPTESKPRAKILAAARYHAEAERLLLPSPLAASASNTAVAANLSLLARREARYANFSSAWLTLRYILWIALGLAFLLGTCRYLQNATTRIIVARLFVDLQTLVVAHVLTLSAGQTSSMRRGDLISRVSVDLAKVVNGVINPLTTLVTQPVRLLTLLVAAIITSWQLSLLLGVLALTVFGPIRYFGKFIRRSARVRQSALAEVLEAMHQMFGGIRIVKMFRREEHERDRFREKTNRAFQAEVGVIRARVASRSWLRLVNDTTIPIVVLGGGWFVVHHVWGMNAGRFATFAGLVMWMYRPTKTLAMAYNTLQDSLPALSRVLEVLDLTPVIKDPEDAVALERIEESIQVEDVSFTYDGEKDVLQEISFTTPVGTTTAFVGHTGSGKSTLMDLIARHLDPTRGRILIDGKPLPEIQLGSYLPRLAAVSQEPFLFNDTVRENIRYGRLDATDAEIEEAARAACIHDEIAKLPGGYDYVVGEMGSKLSGGQIQRLTLARAFVLRPEILLLDEGTSALDAHTERLVQEALQELEKICTTFVIAHRLSTVRHADQILVLNEGRIIERGTHEELLSQGGKYADLVLQMHGDVDES